MDIQIYGVKIYNLSMSRRQLSHVNFENKGNFKFSRLRAVATVMNDKACVRYLTFDRT